MSEPDEWQQLPTARVERGRSRGFRPAIVVSVLLHSALFYALTQLDRAGDMPLPAPSLQPALQVNVVSINPQRVASIPTPSGPDSPAPATVEPPAPAPIAPPPSRSEDTAAPLSEIGSAAKTASMQEAEPQPGIAPLYNAGLQAMITAVVRSEKGVMLEDWLEECTRYRNRYQTKDCPQGEEVKTERQEAIEANMDVTFRSWVTGHARNAQISEALLDDMDSLRPLMESEGLLGALAAERYYFKREQFYYLNGTGGGVRYGGEGILPVLAFTPTSFVLLGGLLSFNLKSGFSVLKAPDPGPARSFSQAEAVHRAPEPVPAAVPEFEVGDSVWPVARFRD